MAEDAWPEGRDLGKGFRVGDYWHECNFYCRDDLHAIPFSSLCEETSCIDVVQHDLDILGIPIEAVEIRKSRGEEGGSVPVCVGNPLASIPYILIGRIKK